MKDIDASSASRRAASGGQGRASDGATGDGDGDGDGAGSGADFVNGHHDGRGLLPTSRPDPMMTPLHLRLLPIHFSNGSGSSSRSSKRRAAAAALASIGMPTIWRKLPPRVMLALRASRPVSSARRRTTMTMTMTMMTRKTTRTTT